MCDPSFGVGVPGLALAERRSAPRGRFDACGLGASLAANADAPTIVWVVAVALAVVAVVVTWIMWRLWRSPYGFVLGFWRGVNDRYCRWWLRTRCDSPCTIPAAGPAILIANHTCSIDPLPLIATSTRPYISFLIAREFSNVPLFGRLTRRIECIPVNRDGNDAEATRAAIRLLRAGGVLGVFIEGRIARPGETLAPKPGAAMLALLTRAPVIPAHISGTHYHDSVTIPFLRRHRVRIAYGQPIDLSAYHGRHGERGVIDEVSALLMDRIRALAPPSGRDARQI